MPVVPVRPRSLGERLQAKRLRSYKHTNKHNHFRQRQAARRKTKQQQAIGNYYAERRYQTQLGLKLKELFIDTEL